MNKIVVVKQDKFIEITSNIYPDSVACVGLDTVYPDIGVDYQYIQWNDTIWGEDYYVDMSDHIQPFTDEQVMALTDTVTNWVQPLGQQGNPTLEQAQDFKRAEITQSFNDAVEAITTALPHEMVSWRKQEEEARAYTIDNTVATPFIDALSATRQLETKAELVAKIIANADAYQVAYAGLLGKYQNLISKINSATTQTELDAIVW